MSRQDFRDIFSGEDEKLSGKRILGTLCCLIALGIAIYALFNCDCIPNIVLLDGMLFTTSLAFWGIASVSNYFHQKMDLQNPQNDSKATSEAANQP
jgi:hypothetical protein